MGKMKKQQIDIYDTAYNNGYFDAVMEASWQCGDCDNWYDSSVKMCPNTFLDKASFKLNNRQSHDV